MLYILSRDFEVVAVANNIGNAMPYYDDLHVQNLQAGSSYYEFTIPTNHEDADKVVEGNYVVRTDLDGNHLMFTIMNIEESHSSQSEKNIYCEDAGMELLNEIEDPYKETTAKDIKYYIGKAIASTDWSIGYCDVDSVRTLVFEEYENILARVLKIAGLFGDVEISFSVKLIGSKVSKKYINIYEKRGESNGKRFTYSKDITSIKRTVDMADVATAIKGIGKTDDKGVTTKFTANTYDNGNIYTEAGNEYVISRSALERWGKQGGHIHRVFQYETSSPTELMNRTIAEMKKRETPSITYEVDVALLERLAGYEEEQVRIGDTVKVIDATFSEALLLEARIVELETSYTDPNKDKAVLGNYKVVKSNISAQLIAIQSKLMQKEATWDEVKTAIGNSETALLEIQEIKDDIVFKVELISSNGLMFKNGQINTTISARVYRGADDITDTLMGKSFIWKKFNKDGVLDMTWNNNNIGIGETITVTNADIVGKATFTCDIDDITP